MLHSRNTARLNPRFLFLPALVALLTVGAWPARAAEGPPQQPLRYDFQAGQTYAYELKIVGELPSTRETYSGQTFYRIQTVDASGQATLSNWGAITPRSETKPDSLAPRSSLRRGPMGFGPRGFGPGFGGPSYGTPRELSIDARGNVVRYSGRARMPGPPRFSGDAQLPFLLGDLAMLLLEPLPAEAQESWTVEREVTIRFRDKELGLPVPFAETEVNRPAKETTRYAIVESTPEGVVPQRVVIEKQYTLETEEQADGKPVLAQRGEGRLTLAGGVPEALEMKYTLELRSGQVTVTLPATVSARRLEEEEAKRLAAEREAKIQQAVEAHRARMAARQEAQGQPLEAADLDELLAKVKAGDADAAAISEHLSQANPLQKRAIIRALGQRPSKEAAEAVASQMGMGGLTGPAGEALRAMGEVAEPAVIPLLEHKDWPVRMEAAKTLATIGTEKSVAPLEKLRATSRGGVNQEVVKALSAIAAREGKP